MGITIRYKTPFAIDLNIGRAYNEECARADKDDWICLRDGDTMFLLPDWGRQIADIMARNSHYDLIGCMTNRLGALHQLHNRQCSGDGNIANHIAIARELHDKHYDQVKDYKQTVAGMFLLFPKRTWECHPFVENDIRFDIHFSRSIMKAGGRLGIATGFYLFHLYRFGAQNPKKEIDHLKICG